MIDHLSENFTSVLTIKSDIRGKRDNTLSTNIQSFSLLMEADEIKTRANRRFPLQSDA